MRVTTTSAYQNTARNLGQALSRTHELTTQISSGKRIATWSDDAPAASAAEAYRNEEADWNSFQRVSDDATGWLASADGVLQSMSSLMGRVRELAVSAQSGALSSTSREAIAQELDGLPAFRRHLGPTAFVEGWGLYTERLADEMGLYSADLDRIGMLSYDAWRASRLVVPSMRQRGGAKLDERGTSKRAWSAHQTALDLHNVHLTSGQIRWILGRLGAPIPSHPDELGGALSDAVKEA